MVMKRNSTFDIMKGLAILFVIVSHCDFPYLPHHALAPMRSSLFFVISGYFAKNWLLRDLLRNGAKRLFIPYFFTCGLMLLVILIADQIFEQKCFTTAVYSVVFGSSSLPEWFLGHKGVNIGPLWFVCASILVRIYWTFLCKMKRNFVKAIVCVLLAYISFFFGGKIVVPWSIFASFGALGFFFAGVMIRKYDLLKSKRVFPFFIVCWVYCASNSFLDINRSCYESFYILDLFGCVGAFFMLESLIERYADLNLKFWKFLNFMGRYSLIAFCIHAVDQCINVHWLPFKFWEYFSTDFEKVCAVILRIGIVACGTYLVTKTSFLKEKIFFVK